MQQLSLQRSLRNLISIAALVAVLVSAPALVLNAAGRAHAAQQSQNSGAGGGQPFSPQAVNRQPCKKVDLRRYLPEPGKQKSNSCMAWALAYASFTCQIAQERNVTHPSAPEDVFSPDFIYSYLSEKGNGIYPSEAIEYVEDTGCASLATMPLGSASPTAASRREAQAYRAIEHEVLTSLDDIKSSLDESIPVILVIHLDDEFKDYSPDAAPYRWSHKASQGPHAICAVGYDDCKNELLIMNSVGTDWKDGGFCWVSYSELSEFSDAAWCREAHKVKVKRAAPITVTIGKSFRKTFGSRARDFTLAQNHHVYETTNNKRTQVSFGDWEVLDLTSDNNALFVLRSDHGIRMMGSDDGQGKPSWIPLQDGPLQRAKVKMMAAARGTSLHALTTKGRVFEFHQDSSRRGTWETPELPEFRRGKFIDLRELQGNLYLTNASGEVLVREPFSDWAEAEAD